jgi:hypothetical protein
MPATMNKPKSRIAIADDIPNHLAQKSRVVQMAGYEPLQLKGKYHAVADLVDELRRQKVDGLVCDHKLDEGNYALFKGAEVVAALYDDVIPALLVTDYVESDLESIRRYRRKVPILIPTGKFTQSAVNQGLEAWMEEVIKHNVPLHRRPRRAVVMVDELIEGPKGRTVTVFVPRWREHFAISIPEELIPEEIRRDLKKGTILTANVNTDAENPEDLFFEDFRMTPEEDLQHDPA